MFVFENWLKLFESTFSNWTSPSEKDIRWEYQREYNKLAGGLKTKFSEDDFVKMAKTGVVHDLSKQEDFNMGYRSHTSSKEELISLLSSYASWPEFRNEKTVDDLYSGFEENRPMKMPIVVRFPNGRLRIFGGNTRLDVAFQLGVTPKVFIIDIPG